MAFFDFDIGDILDVAKLGTQVYAQFKTVQIAEEQAALQAQQLRRQQAITAARAKRETRIRKAQLLASQGIAGARTSTAKSGVIGLGASLEAGLSDLEAQTSGQIAQFDLGVANVTGQAVVNTFASLGTFAATGVGEKTTAGASDFLSGMFADPEGKQTASVGTMGRTDLATTNSFNIA